MKIDRFLTELLDKITKGDVLWFTLYYISLLFSWCGHAGVQQKHDRSLISLITLTHAGDSRSSMIQRLSTLSAWISSCWLTGRL